MGVIQHLLRWLQLPVESFASLLSDLCEPRGFEELLRRAGPVNAEGAEQQHAAVDFVPHLVIRHSSGIITDEK